MKINHFLLAFLLVLVLPCIYIMFSTCMFLDRWRTCEFCNVPIISKLQIKAVLDLQDLLQVENTCGKINHFRAYQNFNALSLRITIISIET